MSLFTTSLARSSTLSISRSLFFSTSSFHNQEHPFELGRAATLTLETTKGRGRSYLVDGQKLSSVTSILSIIAKPFIAGWERKILLSATQQHIQQIPTHSLPLPSQEENEEWTTNIMKRIQKKFNFHKNAPSKLGTRAHDQIDDILSGKQTYEELQKNNGDLYPILESFLEWKCDFEGWIHLDSERTVFSTTHQYAGTIDAVFAVPPKEEEEGKGEWGIALVDWKTGNGIYTEYALQLAAYAFAFEEMERIPVTELWVVRLDKQKKKYEAKKIERDQAWNAFMLAKNLQDTLQKDPDFMWSEHVMSGEGEKE